MVVCKCARRTAKNRAHMIDEISEGEQVRLAPLHDWSQEALY